MLRQLDYQVPENNLQHCVVIGNRGVSSHSLAAWHCEKLVSTKDLTLQADARKRNCFELRAYFKIDKSKHVKEALPKARSFLQFHVERQQISTSEMHLACLSFKLDDLEAGSGSAEVCPTHCQWR